MAEFTFIPDYGANIKITPRVKLAKFNDNYEQRYADGINTMPRIADLVFSNRDQSEIEDINSFLAARAGVQAFDWTPPDPYGNPGKFVCRAWQATYIAANILTITATFEEVAEA